MTKPDIAKFAEELSSMVVRHFPDGVAPEHLGSLVIALNFELAAAGGVRPVPPRPLDPVLLNKLAGYEVVRSP